MFEQRRVNTSEETFGGGRTVGATNIEIVHGCERRELAVTEAVTAMMIQRELTVAPFDGRTAALKQFGAFTGDLLDTPTSR